MSTRDAYQAELARLLRNFAENIRRLREQTKPGQSQEAVADEANLHRTQWGKIEAGERDPRMSTLLIVADALGVTLNDLVDGIPAPKERKPPPHKTRTSSGHTVKR